jgi:hypothetical protein
LIRPTAFLALALALAACTAGPSPGNAGGPAAPDTSAVPFETLVQTAVPGQAGKEVRRAVRDDAAWRALWSELRQDSSLAEQPPAIDFDREMVVAAAMETQSCVSRVTVRAIRRSGDGLTVDLLEEPPAPNCRCIVAARPLHVVRLQKVPGDVRFTAERGQLSCGG